MTAVLKLLIVEDSVDDTELVLRHIKKGGISYTYDRVDTEIAMIRSLEQNEWDAIISDYSMLQFSGISALSVAKRVKPNLPFIIVSGSIGEDIAIEALKAGADDYVLKQNLTRLVPALQRELRETAARFEHQKIESAMKRGEEELRQAQKLEAIGQLAGGIAHDFNNILATMIIQADILSELLTTVELEKPSLDALKKGIDQIKKSGDRATRLTRQLLTFSRKQVLQPKVINLNTLISNMEHLLKRTIEENIQFKYKLDPALKCLKIDPTHIEQIVLNFAVNARDSMPHGGMIELTTSNEKLNTESAEIQGLPPGDYIAITFSDNGSGIDKEVLPRIFEPFFTTKPIGKGTGLGLSTVYGIVKQNSGIISVESEVNVGTTFKICFPAVDDLPIENHQDSISKSPANLVGNENILVAEDEDDLRSIVCETLISSGYKVVATNDGTEALLAIKNSKSPFQLIVTDVVMPKMGGPDLAREAAKIDKNIDVIFLSGYTEDVLIQQGVSKGSIHFIEKPFTLKNLLSKVRNVLEKKKTGESE